MRDILFVEEVLASVTHEMQNVMAIIKESGALADDILDINGRPRMKHGERMDNALTTIQDQVQRGRGLMLMLNGFAHAASDNPTHCDLERYAHQICTLAERMARLKECSLERVPQGPPIFVRGNALMIMQSIYRALAEVLETCAPGSTVCVTTDSETVEATLHVGLVQGKARAGNAIPDADRVSGLVAEIGGSCRGGECFLELRYILAPASVEGAS